MLRTNGPALYCICTSECVAELIRGGLYICAIDASMGNAVNEEAIPKPKESR